MLVESPILQFTKGPCNQKIWKPVTSKSHNFLHVNNHLNYVKSFAYDCGHFQSSINWAFLREPVIQKRLLALLSEQNITESLTVTRVSVECRKDGAGVQSIPTTNSRCLFVKHDGSRKQLHFSPGFPTECCLLGIWAVGLSRSTLVLVLQSAWPVLRLCARVSLEEPAPAYAK